MTLSQTANTNTPFIFESYSLDYVNGSPFLKATSRGWGENSRLQASLLSVFMLAAAFIFSFLPLYQPLSSLFLVIVYFLAGIPALIESIENISELDINIDVLMTLAAFSSVLLGSAIEGGLLLVLFEISGALEETVTQKAKGALSHLHRLAPSQATVVEMNGTLIERSVKDIDVGTTILVKAGQVNPLDGKVIDGSSSVNLVHLTGENLPVSKKIGDEVAAGARNLEGSLTLKVIRSNADSALSRIIQLVTEAQEARPKLQRWFDQISRQYALSIILFSAFFALTLPLLGNVPYLGSEGSIYRALAFLIAASPCALIIAIPIAYLSAVSACARKGILLKGGIVLDALASCKIIAFDKTGTLTSGELSLIGIETLKPSSNAEIQQALSVAIALERNAIHPIAKALLDYAPKDTPLIPLRDFKLIPGFGLEGKVDLIEGEELAYIGKPEYILPYVNENQKVQLQNQINKIQEQGELLALLFFQNRITLFRFKDQARPDIDKTLSQLSSKKWELLMLTGDHSLSAKAIAKEVGIKHVFADLRPEDKLEHVSRLSQEKGLAMIGDGINDAPALARATVGIGMGKFGSNAAIEVSDVVLLNDNLESLPWLMKKAQQTQLVVKQNLIIAICAILVATTPALLGWIPLWLAVVLHEGGTVIVGLNALRLLR